MSKEKKIYVVGIGPGSYEGMTGAAATALEKSDVIVGYTVYIDLVKDHFPGKSFLTTPMRKEVDRCVMAFDEAMKDQTVSMICSGDAGVYGMAGLMYEIGANYPEGGAGSSCRCYSSNRRSSSSWCSIDPRFLSDQSQ